MNNYVDLVPSPISLIESLRNIGYSTETSIADIIDNSITAGASRINIRFAWNAGVPWVAVTDDGSGMTEEELISAMRFGSTCPLEARSAGDLGRFGLGMKTASFSQCRRLTVVSRKHHRLSCCKWDLDELAEAAGTAWKLSILNPADIYRQPVPDDVYNETATVFESGTLILWENIDRIRDQVPPAKQEAHFNDMLDRARKHLELVFHRYLSPEPGRKKITITMNGDALDAFNPFNPRNLATQELEAQQILLEGEMILVQPYVLPHHSKVSRRDYNYYAGEGGYLHNQGFYVYRNRRLIIKGTWFRLIKKEELNKLIRVRVDIPNSLDHLWKIDVKKSHASPPETIRNELKQVIDKIAASGRRVYRQRGTKLTSDVNSPVWNRVASGNKISYQINREQPLVEQFSKLIPGDMREFFENLMTMFESSFPTDMFFNDVAGNPEQVGAPRFQESSLEMLLDIFLESWAEAGVAKNEIAEKLLSTDPFASNRSVTEKLLQQRGYNCE